jgi:hypothetical protein
MPVVINEFEVATGNQPAQQTVSAPATTDSSGKAPVDLEQVLKRRLERLERVRAH